MILLVMVAGFAAFNFLVVTINEGPGPGLLTAFGTPLGPLTGGISRNLQRCCLDFSLSLVPVFLPILLLGIFAQLRPREASAFSRRGSFIRSLLWSAGWGLWFFSGIISFSHALS